MPKSFPKLISPPIVEMVMGIQFAPLPAYSTAHSGLFWRDHLGKDWVKALDAPRLLDSFELFGAERVRGAPAGFVLRTAPGPERVQIINRDDARMIQIQDSRLVQNWRACGGAYPSYRQLFAEYQGHVAGFKRFTADAGVGDVQPNQWEVTYIDQIPQGELWKEPKDWPKIIPAISPLSVTSGGPEAEDFSMEWHLVIPDQRGRVRVAIRRGKASDDAPESLVIQMLARGPVSSERQLTWEAGVELGHDAIGSVFFGMISPAVLEIWSRKR